MKIQSWVQLKQAEDVRFRSVGGLGPYDKSLDGPGRSFINSRRDLAYLQIGSKPNKIDLGVLGTSHQTVALYVVEPIGVELARHNRAVHVDRPFLDHVRHVIRKPAAERIQRVCNLSVTNKGITNRLVLSCKLESQSLCHVFERMTEGAVTQIMNERSCKRALSSTRAKIGVALVSLNNPHKSPRDVERTHTVRKT